MSHRAISAVLIGVALSLAGCSSTDSPTESPTSTSQGSTEAASVDREAIERPYRDLLDAAVVELQETDEGWTEYRCDSNSPEPICGVYATTFGTQLETLGTQIDGQMQRAPITDQAVADRVNSLREQVRIGVAYADDVRTGCPDGTTCGTDRKMVKLQVDEVTNAAEVWRS